VQLSFGRAASFPTDVAANHAALEQRANGARDGARRQALDPLAGLGALLSKPRRGMVRCMAAGGATAIQTFR
jgi:hypothetical protein